LPDDRDRLTMRFYRLARMVALGALALCLGAIAAKAQTATPTPTPEPPPASLIEQADLDGDGSVEPDDFFLFQRAWHWDRIGPTATPTNTPTVTPTHTPNLQGIWTGTFSDTTRERATPQSGTLTWSLQQEQNQITQESQGFDSLGHQFTKIVGTIQPGRIVVFEAEYRDAVAGGTNLSYTGILTDNKIDGAYTGSQDHDHFDGVFSISISDAT